MNKKMHKAVLRDMRVSLFMFGLFWSNRKWYRWLEYKIIAIDICKILRYDRRKRKGKSSFTPVLRTEMGETYFLELLESYKEKLPINEETYQQQLIRSGGWPCDCGRVNPIYTSTCVCGKNRRKA